MLRKKKVEQEQESTPGKQGVLFLMKADHPILTPERLAELRVEGRNMTYEEFQKLQRKLGL